MYKAQEIFIEEIGKERFYPHDIYGPLVSVTTFIGAVYPKSQFLIDWQIETGKERAKEILEEAGEEGTRIHSYIETIVKGGSIGAEGITPKARKALKGFINWYNKVNPEVVAIEQRVDYVIEKGVEVPHKFAGTIDLVCYITDPKTGVKELWIVDFKTSNSVWPSHHVQVATYGKAWNSDTKNERITKGAILHLNSSAQQGYSWNKVDMVKNQAIGEWCLEGFYLLNPDAQPKYIEYPKYFNLIKDETSEQLETT